MNNLNQHIKCALLIGAFFLCAARLGAQGSLLELLPGPEKLTYNEKTGVQHLVGNISFTYQGNVMYCDSADFHQKNNEVRAYGHVHINRNDSLNLYCDSLYYHGKTKKAKLWGHVRILDRQYKLTSDSLEYDVALGQGVYRNYGKLESLIGKEVLTSKVGYFYPKSKDAFFKGDVKYNDQELTMTTDTLRYRYWIKTAYFYGPTTIKNKEAELFCNKGWYQIEREEGVLQGNAQIYSESKTIRGDSIYYHKGKGLTIGRGNIYYTDSLEPIAFEGDYFCKNDSLRHALLTGNAICQYRMKEQDTLFIHADTLTSEQDSLGKVLNLHAFHGVRFFKTDFQGVCDSLSYLAPQEKLNFYYKPIVWTKKVELKGEAMTLFLKDSTIHKIDVTDKASAISLVDTIGYYNQVGGKRMEAFFIKDELHKVHVEGNAQTVYFPEETTNRDSIIEIQRKGMNRVYASSLNVYLDSGEVVGVTYVDKPDAVFYPIPQLNKEEQYIQYFSWKPMLRPKNKADLFLK